MRAVARTIALGAAAFVLLIAASPVALAGGIDWEAESAARHSNGFLVMAGFLVGLVAGVILTGIARRSER